ASHADLSNSIMNHHRANNNIQIDRSVQGEIPDSPRIDSAWYAFKIIDDLQGSPFRRPRHGAARKTPGNTSDGRLFQSSPDGRNELMDRGIGFDLHQRRHMNRAGDTGTGQVVSQEVDDHQILTEELLVGKQMLPVRFVFLRVCTAAHRALDRLAFNHALRADFQESLWRAAKNACRTETQQAGI